ncbi:MAG: hypothetical protein GY730_06640 [bacterium]|nr:hypothetical protein [bacterium]
MEPKKNMYKNIIFENNFDMEDKKQINALIEKYPRAINNIISDIKERKIKEKCVNLPNNNGQLCFKLKINRISLHHVKTEKQKFPEIMKQVFDEIEYENRNKHKSLTQKGLDTNILNQVDF